MIDEFKQKNQNLIEKLKQELATVRTNRPNSGIIENIQVDYYGKPLPIKQLASISIVPPREINIQVWDKSAAINITKAIESSSLGFSVNAEGNLLRIYLPELSQERREELIRYVKKETEKYRIELRHFRDEANKKIQKMSDEKTISEDAKFKLKEDIQKETDKTNEAIEEVLESKIKEISL